MEDVPIAPSPPESAISAGSGREGGGTEPPKKARRTFLTQNACTRCRQKKSKCDGRRPICGRCSKNGAQCIYDVAQEGLTRMQNLQQMLEKKTEDFDRVMTLFGAFQQGSDELATNLLARLRMGESIQSLVQELGTSQISATGDAQDMSDSQDSRSMHSWPASPLDQGAWSLWSARGSQVGTSSLSPEYRLGASRASSTLYSYPAPDGNPQVDGESPRQEQAPYFQSQYTQDGDAEPVQESRRPSNTPQEFVVPRRPSRGSSRK